MDWDVHVKVVDVYRHLLIHFVAFDGHVLLLNSWLVSTGLFFEPSPLFLLSCDSSSVGIDVSQLCFELNDSPISLLEVSLELLVFHLGALVLVGQLPDSDVSLLDLPLFKLNVREHVLGLNLDVHIDSLLLVDVPVPHLDAQLLFGDSLFVLNVLDVAVRDLLEVVDHLCENVNLFLNNLLVVLDQSRVLTLEVLQLGVVDFLQHFGLDLFLLLSDLHDVFVHLSDLLHVVLHLLVDALLGGLPHCVV